MRPTLKIALAGNPNSGKTTLFNTLTGSNQYVGNWPGVTVERKGGMYKKDDSIEIIDLPGIYSLSPYTSEEVITREYLLENDADVLIDVVDASNIERNLYLSTQLSELDIPMLIALNKMDTVRKNGDHIDTDKLQKLLGCPIVEVSALKNEGLDELMSLAKEMAKERHQRPMNLYDNEMEQSLSYLQTHISSLQDKEHGRWYAIKLFEQDKKVTQDLDLSAKEEERLHDLIRQWERKLDDDSEGIIINQRYEFVSMITQKTVRKGRTGLTHSDRIDQVVTSRLWALPIFILVMTLIYWLAIKVVGGPLTDFLNEEFIPNVLQSNAESYLESMNIAPWLISLVVHGMIGGVGSVVGFLPQIAVLFLLLAIVEDVGYMSRIAFILDRVFRRFGLSGKSFIPILIGTGCSVPGILATRTIENENDRRMTIISASFLPCSAKTEIVALFAGSVFTGKWWFAPLCYFIGILAVIISGLVLKKTRMFSGDASPFVMELPEYHIPNTPNILKQTWDKVKGFLAKAGTVILLASITVWLLQNISISGEFHNFESDATDSLLAFLGKIIAPVFGPLGFGDWISTVATLLGLIAKELFVGTLGVLSGFSGIELQDPSAINLANHLYTPVSALSIMVFNQLTVPCFAAVGAIRQEMASTKWTIIALGYQLIFSYTISLMIFQIGSFLIMGQAFHFFTFVAFAILITYLYLMLRSNREHRRTRLQLAD